MKLGVVTFNVVAPLNWVSSQGKLLYQPCH